MRSHTLKWLHRVGYVATAIVFVQLIGLLILGVYVWRDHHTYVSRSKAATQTKLGKLTPLEPRWHPDELDMLEMLPELGGGSDQALRFISLPWRNGPRIVLELKSFSGVKQAKGALNILAQPTEENEAAVEKTILFSMPAASARRLFSDVGKQTDGWEGDVYNCLHGVSVAFELTRNGFVTSGAGNAACGDHYRVVNQLVLDRVKHLIPATSRSSAVQ